MVEFISLENNLYTLRMIFIDRSKIFTFKKSSTRKERTISIFLYAILGTIFLLINNCQKDNIDSEPNSVTDIDLNIYHTVKIGSQVWMADNLKTTKFNDGTAIPKLTYVAGETAGYCWYRNDISHKYAYGALYAYKTVVDPHGLCPTGWHVPTLNDLTALNTYLGVDTAGGMLKQAGTTRWLSPNTGATNATGFTALPGGYCHANGSFFMGYAGFWWCSTEVEHNYAYFFFLTYNSSLLNVYYGDKSGILSVRCIKD